MIINKENKLVDLLKKMLEEANTPNCSTVVSKIKFVANKGIRFEFPDKIKVIRWKMPEVDFNRVINDSFFVTVLLSEILNKGKAEILLVNDDLIINSVYKFFSTEGDDSFGRDIQEWQIKFTKEQFEKLESDFTLTVGNYFQNSKTTDVIGFAFHQGSVYKLAPGVHIYKIEKLDATIDNVFFEQNYGHSTDICIIPRKVWEIAKGEEVKFFLTQEGNIYIYTNNMRINYELPAFGSRIFEKRIAYFGKVPTENFIKISDLKKFSVKSFIDNSFKEEEDKTISISNGLVKIDDCQFKVDDFENINISTNLNVFNYMINNFHDDSLLTEMEDDSEEAYVITNKENNLVYFIPKYTV